MSNNKKQQKMFSFISNLQSYYHFELDFQKVDQVVNPRHQSPQGQSVAKPGTLLENILAGNVNMT